MFIPRVAGVFIGELILHSTPVGSKKVSKESGLTGTQSGRPPLLITLQAISEQPNIEVIIFI